MLHFSTAIQVLTGFGMIAAFTLLGGASSFPAHALRSTTGVCAMQIGGQSYNLPTCPQQDMGR